MIELLLIGALAQVAVVPRGAEELPWPPWRQILSALEEPAIDAFPRDGRVFRFVWVPPFPSMRLCGSSRGSRQRATHDWQDQSMDGSMDL